MIQKKNNYLKSIIRFLIQAGGDGGPSRGSFDFPQGHVSDRCAEGGESAVRDSLVSGGHG